MAAFVAFLTVVVQLQMAVKTLVASDLADDLALLDQMPIRFEPSVMIKKDISK